MGLAVWRWKCVVLDGLRRFVDYGRYVVMTSNVGIKGVVGEVLFVEENG